MVHADGVAELDAFDGKERNETLRRLFQESGGIMAASDNVNMHMHSFFSYNAEGWSPSHLVWASRSAGLYGAGLCDFDVLDGLEEFLAAGRLVGLRTAVHLETRAYFSEYANVDINSPGEPGVTYIMGGAFPYVPAPESQAGRQLAVFRDGARSRNEALVNRLNGKLPEIAVDYAAGVLPLTPTGNATERHIISAYVNQAASVFDDAGKLAVFWADVIEKSVDEVNALRGDRPALEEAIRSRLAKRGGVGYIPPSSDTFPPADAFIKWVTSCDAIPMITWLDGTSGGEADSREMCECLCAKGAAALNIVPDRNWNISDSTKRAVKVENLKTIVGVATDMGLPINIGTEMNKSGLPFVDDLDGDVLGAFKDAFVAGARIMVGHTLLARYAAFPYTGQSAESEFPDIKERNRFFESVGRLPPVTEAQSELLTELGPEQALSWFRDTLGRL